MENLNPLIVSVNDYLEIKSDKGRKYAIKNRSTYGISFCRTGKIVYTMNGKKYISDSHHAVILPKGGTYNLYGTENGSFPLINFNVCNNTLGDEICVISLQHPGEYLALFDRIFNLSPGKQTFPAKMSILYKIFDLLQSEDQPCNPLQNVEDYIHKHFQETELNNATLSGICKLSETGFRKKFSKIYGISPKQYIIEKRLERAEALLKTTDLTIYDIAQQCGFSNIYYFFTAFKERQHCTPKEYRLSKTVL